jgi:transmembrane sensor
MTSPNGEDHTGSNAETEAASWFARLQSRSIGIGELNEFARWRRLPANAEAYRRIEQFWEAGGLLERDPDVDLLVKKALDGGAATSWWRKRATVISGIGLIVAACVIVAVVAAGALERGRSYRTTSGVRSLAVLDDGSRMQIDASTTVVADFSARHRIVRVERGQAFFSVRHDASRPFVVDLGNGVSVTALGTQFDVRRDASRLSVGLLQGSVEVRRGPALIARLRPGEAIDVPVAADARPVHRDIAPLMQWRSGRLAFRSTPLREALDEVNRYASTPIVLKAADRGSMPISGEFEAGDADAFLAAVNVLLGAGTVGWSKPGGS